MWQDVEMISLCGRLYDDEWIGSIEQVLHHVGPVLMYIGKDFLPGNANLINPNGLRFGCSDVGKNKEICCFCKNARNMTKRKQEGLLAF